MVAPRAIVKAAVATRRNRVCALVGITALLLPQRLFKVNSRRPERKQSLPVLVLSGREQRLLLQQVAKQNRLLCVCVGLVAKFLLFRIPGAFSHAALRSRFAQLSDLRIHVQKNLLARIARAERRLVFRQDLPCDIVALLIPVPGLPGQECSDAADILWKEIDASRSQIVGLNRDVGQISSSLNLGLQVRLLLFDRGNLDLGALRKCELSSGLQIHLFRQCSRNSLDRKVDEKISAKQPVQSLFPVSESVFGDKELVLGLCFLGFDAKTVRLQSGPLLQSALRQLIELFKRMDRRALGFGLTLRLE